MEIIYKKILNFLEAKFMLVTIWRCYLRKKIANVSIRYSKNGYFRAAKNDF